MILVFLKIYFSLELFENWINCLTNVRVDIIVIALSEILSGSHEWSESYDNKIVFDQKLLKNTPEVIDIRKISLLILKSFIYSKDIDYVIQTLDVVNNN